MQYQEFPPLQRDDLADDPIEQFRLWFADAEQASPLAEGMMLSTVDPDTQPSSRAVLLKGFDQRGFVFYTNYLSRKSRALEKNPRAALLFWWKELGRQVRIEGLAERVTDEESDAYFATRPRGSQIAAWASEQSEELPSREALEKRVAEHERQFDDGPVPRPPFWGGYRVIPDRIEFWQGQGDRLHDRFLYEREGKSGWTVTRLAP